MRLGNDATTGPPNTTPDERNEGGDEESGGEAGILGLVTDATDAGRAGLSFNTDAPAPPDTGAGVTWVEEEIMVAPWLRGTAGTGVEARGRGAPDPAADVDTDARMACTRTSLQVSTQISCQTSHTKKGAEQKITEQSHNTRNEEI